MPTIITDGAASAQGYGFAARSVAVNYIEDVFSTYLYTGNSSTQTITNGVDLAGKGGLVWFKSRGTAHPNVLFDTARGANISIRSNSTSAQENLTSFGVSALTSFTSTGFQLGDDVGFGAVNTSPNNYVSWTFRKQAKFFDVVTYTGNGANGTAYNIAHNLTSKPGFVIIKRTDSTGDWAALARVDANNSSLLFLNTTNSGNANTWIRDRTTTTTFDVGTSSFVANDFNINGATYVAYLFAHDAGGFGATGADNVISCGSYTGNGSATGPTITLGYEPQWLLVKNATGAGNWQIIDNMRGMPVGFADATLQANLTNAESSVDYLTPSATGFQITSTSTEVNTSAYTYIYIAIRRGPMKTPSVGTSVYSPVAYTGGTINRLLSYGFPVDFWIDAARTGTSLVGYEWPAFTRLLSVENALETTNTKPWSGGWGNGYLRIDNNSGVYLTTSTGYLNQSPGTFIGWGFGRAPGFFDVVCYTGTGANRTVSHNLGVAPELMIVKGRSGATAWQAYSSALSNTEYLVLNTTAAKATGATRWNSTTPTASVFSLGTASEVNTSTATYVAYLFATVAGVSKVGSYTGTGTTKQIDCGFTGGARFVLIKRTDSTGDWYVWDSARGIVAGNDPYILLNSTAAEVTNTDYVDTYSAGFEISSTAPAAINANGGSFIFLAIA